MRALISIAFASVLSSALLASESDEYRGNETPIDISSAKFASPDKKHVVSFESKDDGWDYLDIKDSTSGREESSIKIELPPLFSVQWTGDSRSLVLVGHVAHGSTLILVNSKDALWTSTIFYPADFDGDPAYNAIFYDVKKVALGSHDAAVTYELTVQLNPQTDQGFHEKSCLVTLSLDIQSGRVVKSKRTELR